MITGYRPKNDWRSIPQNIRFLASNPCSTTPWIYVETLLEAVGDIFLDLISLDPRSIAIGYLRPKSRRGWRRFHKGATEEAELGLDAEERGLLEDIAGELREGELPDISRAIGRHLPGARQIKALSSNKIGHMIWVPIDVAERALWYWMLFDLSKDGIYDWASDIYKAGCPATGVFEGWGQYSNANSEGVPFDQFGSGTSTGTPGTNCNQFGANVPQTVPSATVTWILTQHGDFYNIATTSVAWTATIYGHKNGKKTVIGSAGGTLSCGLSQAEAKPNDIVIQGHGSGFTSVDYETTLSSEITGVINGTLDVAFVWTRD